MRTNLPEAERQDGKLPAFASPEVAEHELFAKRDDSLRWLEGFVRRRGTELTYEPGALDSLERLYFELWGGGVASRVRGNRSSFESAMGVFWGASRSLRNERPGRSMKAPSRQTISASPSPGVG